MIDRRAANESDNCSKCGKHLDEYRPDVPIPYSWIQLLHEEEEIEGFKSYTRPCIELCDDCQPRVDFVLRQTAPVQDPTEMDEVFRNFIVQNFDEGDLIDSYGLHG